MGTSSCLSLVSFYGGYLRRTFTSAGLSRFALDIDDQTTLSFWAPAPPLPIPPKPSLVLIHGFGPVSLWQWQQQVHDLSRHFSLYVPDLVFFGGSTTASEERSEVFQAGAVARLMEKVGVDRYSVLGTSYGGFVAYNMGRMWPDRVEKVVIASSGVNMRRRDNEELLKRAGHGGRIEISCCPPRPPSSRSCPRSLCSANPMLLGSKVQLEVIKNSAHVPQIENPKRFNDCVGGEEREVVADKSSGEGADSAVNGAEALRGFGEPPKHDRAMDDAAPTGGRTVGSSGGPAARTMARGAATGHRGDRRKGDRERAATVAA
ncbi:hypothetical protein Syun_011576 [Stephania yunnanensis]|uniref:AB hydrolase-1 domain-containing protein n=1 Tax=Stephania yunnanensis TaxID=152371 RepID=A0AAP0JXU3_9MAGN